MAPAKSKSALNIAATSRFNQVHDDDSDALPSDLPSCLIHLAHRYCIPVDLRFEISVEEEKTLKKPPTKTNLPDNDSEDTLLEDRFITIGIVVDHYERPLKVIIKEPIPRELLMLLRLIVPQHSCLSAIEVQGKGHSVYTLHEINRIILHSNITEICFDGARVTGNSYYLLLDETHTLMSLSLARCSITDDIVKEIANRLEYGKSASKNMRILNLSSNTITDVGGLAISKMLETNRSICYLNLSNNQLSDMSGIAILTVLHNFRISDEDYRNARRLHLVYLQEKHEAAKDYFNKLMSIERPKSAKSPKPKTKTTGKTNNLSADDAEMTLEKAKDQMPYPPFDYPFYIDATPQPGDGALVRGNVVVCRLNLSYNRMTKLTLTRAMPIMQSAVDGKRGPFLFCFEGTMLPSSSDIQAEADKLMEMQLNMYGHGRKAKPEKRHSLKNNK